MNHNVTSPPKTQIDSSQRRGRTIGPHFECAFKQQKMTTKSTPSFTFLLRLMILSACMGGSNGFAVEKTAAGAQPVGDILILDHLNTNHEKGRHDLLKAFYFDFLKLAVDLRKEENLIARRKTVWVNCGAQQFHLPEDKPDVQVLDSVVTLVCSDLDPLHARAKEAEAKLQGTLFAVEEEDINHVVTDPWGSKFKVVQGLEEESKTLEESS